MSRTHILLAATALLVGGPALAQTTPPPGPGGTQAIPEQQGTPMASGQGDNGQGESLSHKLSKSGGVIQPQADVDPGMHVPAPEPHPNSTPVIPPSATGGNTAK